MGTILRNIQYFLENNLGTEPSSISFYAISIIIITILLKIVTIPVGLNQSRMTAKTREIQPEIEALKKKYKNDPQNLAVKQQQLYKEAGINPLGGCLPMIVQLLLMLGIYRVLLQPETYAFKDAAHYVAMNKEFFWLADISKPDPYMAMPIISGLTQFLQGRLMPQPAAGGDDQQNMMTSMTTIMPIMMIFITRRFPAGALLYWIVSNIFSMCQQLIVNALSAKKQEA